MQHQLGQLVDVMLITHI